MFHVLAFNPHPLLRHCVDSSLFISLYQPEEGYVENSAQSHSIQSLVFSPTREIRMDKSIRLVEHFKRNSAVRELSLATLTANRTLELKSLSLFSNSKTRTES